MQFPEGIIELLQISKDNNILMLIVALLYAFLVLFIFTAPFAGIVSYVERRIAGRMQARIGPNRVGPQGILQWIADGIKVILKEDFIPPAGDSLLFHIGPYLVFTGMFATFAVIPFGSHVVGIDFDVAIVYLVAVSSLVVIGIILSGWSSNNKWSVLGGLRSAAQIIAYEIPSGIALTTIVLLSGTLSIQKIIMLQGPWPWQWNVFGNPAGTIAFFIFFISSLAESNRTPFDLPEAESELVSGYNTEYSGFRFAVFFLSEWANLYVISAIATAVFLGGWQVPLIDQSSKFYPILSIVIFMLKAFILVFVIIWLRWTLPRLRIDQMMEMCWKYLVPIGFLALFIAGLWLFFFRPTEPIFGVLTFLSFVFAFVLMLKRAIGYVKGAKETITLKQIW